MVARRTQIALITLLVAVTAIAGALLTQSDTERTLATGIFHSVAHNGKGNVRIFETSQGKRFLLITEFYTYHRPDLVILLISASDASENETVKSSEIFNVGRLKSDEGSIEYELSSDLDLSRFNAVTVWSERYEVNFTTAPLTKTLEHQK